MTAGISWTQQLSERLEDICIEIGRDLATIQCSELAHNANSDPFSSLDAFEHIHGCDAFGIAEFTVYWCLIEQAYRQRMLGLAELQARFERIASARITDQ